MTVRIITGDNRQVLKTLPDRSVHCCVSSPPYYGLRDYGHAGQIGLEDTPDAFVAELVAVFREVRRVLRDDGTLWLNLGDSYAGSWGAQSRGGPPSDSSTLRGNGHVGSGLKPKDLIGVPWMVAFALRADGWWLRQDIVWCLSGGAAVYARTQKGDMPVMVKDLVRLRPETVKLWNGSKWTQVLGWNRSTDTDGALEIELRSGERIGCTPGHQWPTKRGLLKASDLVPGDVIETTRLPEPETPKSADALGIDVAWLCGLYLAEGSMSGDKVQIAGHAKESAVRLERIERVASSFHGSANVYTSENKANIVVSGPVIASVIRAYVHGNSAQDKGIKVRAWARSDEWLMAFLQGYLAGDGHYDADNDRWRLAFCRNDRLADDFRTLAARLGLPLRLNATTATGFGREWPSYRGDIRLVPTAHWNARIGSAIVAIRPSRARQFWDIGVQDEPHTFAFASGVLTHNSKPNPMPESVQDRCTKAHEYIFLLSKSATYHCDMAAIAEPSTGQAPGNHSHKGETAFNDGDEHHRTKSGLTAYAQRQRSKRDSFKREDSKRAEVFPGQSMGTHRPDREESAYPLDTRNKRSVWTVATQPFSEAHFATFPPDLIEPCIKSGCPEHACSRCGIALDSYIQTSRSSTNGNALCALPNGIQEVSIAVGADAVLQPAMLGDGAHSGADGGALRVVRGARGTRQKGSTKEVLQQSVRVSMDSKESFYDEGLFHHEQGLQSDLQAGPSFGDSRGLCDGAQARDGAEVRTTVDQERDRSPQERSEDRQPAEQSRSDVEGVARSVAQADPPAAQVPALSGTHRHDRASCPGCGADLSEEGAIKPGVCLDPFGGAGTTGLVADRLQRDAVLIELNPDYAAMARRRVIGDAPLFAEVA